MPIVVYAWTLRIPQDRLEEADRRVKALAQELDPHAQVERGVTDGDKPAYHAAGLLHEGEPRLAVDAEGRVHG
jgi:hypothetical protein